MTTPQLPLIGFVTLTALAVGCSLTVPSEQELFSSSGGSPSSGASSGAKPADVAGSVGAGGTPQASEPTAGEAGAAETGGASGSPGEPPELGGAAGESGVLELPEAVLFLHYTFDDVSEFVAEDVSGNERHGTLAGISLPGGMPGHIDGALKLDGTQKQYVQLPKDILEGQAAISISSWLKLAQALAWDRLFDFNSGESNWFFFSPTGWNNNTSTFGTRCATRTPAALAPEIMLTETVSIDTWHHIAVVFAKPYLRYYLDGELKWEIDQMSFSSDSLGKTSQNWIGRSVYAADPYLSALVDDFRIYSGALSAAEIEALATE